MMLTEVEINEIRITISSGDSYLLLLNSHFFGSSRLEMFLEEGVLEVCGGFAGERPCRNSISMKLQGNFVEITLRRGCSPVGLLRIFGAPFPESTSGRLLLCYLKL